MSTVNFYPWSEEVFRLASQEEKPVFLSIGYATCHSCHTMATQVFTDPRVSAILNSEFIPVAADSQLRPDINAVYMKICRSLCGNAGWPMTVIMTAEQQPFFASAAPFTEDITGFIRLLETIAEKWKYHREDLLKIAADVSAYSQVAASGAGRSAPADFAGAAAQQLMDSYDSEYGGFGNAPKFLCAQDLIFLMRYSSFKNDPKFRKPALYTLQQMYRGGIFDHFGGGFFHYSADREWLAPHFEKSLSDNAMMAMACTEAWLDGHFDLYRKIAESILHYCIHDLQDENGGYYAGQDADSRGMEGGYYIFHPDEIQTLLGEDAGKHFCECYDITEEGNYRGENIPNLLLNTRWNMLPEGYADYCAKLCAFRAKRSELLTDCSVLTEKNALMLSALSRACSAFGNFRYLQEAKKLERFLAGMTVQGKLIAAPGESMRAGLRAHAFLGNALLDLYAADYNCAHITAAEKLADDILKHFAAPDGGFYDYPDDSEPLILRTKELYDDELPSGNCAAARLFSRLKLLTGKRSWKNACEMQLRTLSVSAGKYPAGCASAADAYLAEKAGQVIVCVTDDEEPPVELDTVTAKYAPELAVILKTPSSSDALAVVAPFTAGMTAINDKATFYICTGGTISAPVTL